MMDLSIAIRNLLRNRRRSFATLMALAIGTAAILLFGGYRANIEYTMHTSYVRDGGHLQIQHRDYFLYGSGNPIAYGISDHHGLMAAISADPELQRHVRVITPLLQFGGIASHAEADVSRTVLAVGMVGADINRMREWNQFGLPVMADHFALDGAAADAALIGTGLARVLRLCGPLGIEDCPQPVAEAIAEDAPRLPADVASLALREQPARLAARAGGPGIDLLATGSGGAPNVVALQVLRAERHGFKELDEIYLQMQLPLAQRLVYGRAEPKVTSLMVQLQRTDQLEPARQRLTELLQQTQPGQALAVRDFRELNPFFVQTVQMFGTIFGFIFVLIGAIVLFTVGNTMSTAVMERTVEIGTIRALGVRQRGIQRLFVTEGMLLGVAGTVFGAAFAIVAAASINSLGLTWMPPGSGTRLPLLLVVWGETGTITTTTIGLAAVAAASAWWPAYRASRLVVVDALRHV